jgi:hypothetical protein
MRVYSAVIAALHNVGSGVPITLDSTFLWVVRDIEVFFPGPALSATLSIVDVATSATLWSWTEDAIQPTGYHEQWEGRVVLAPPPDTFTLLLNGASTAGNPDVRISGYKLSVS